MKLSLFIPVAGAILALAACNDNEPVQQSTTSTPAQRGSPTATNGSAKSSSPATDTGTTPMNTPPVLRGENAEIVGPAKTNPGTTGMTADGATTGSNPPVLRGDQAEVVGQPRTTPTPSVTTVDAVAPATAGNAAEAMLVPDRDAAAKADAQSRAADDSGRNKREDGTQLTPLDQGSSEADLMITQGIRSRVVDRDDLSTNAKNAKIITQNGVVTLRGPVANAQERDTVATIAKTQAGVTRIDNHLEPLQR